MILQIPSGNHTYSDRTFLSVLSKYFHIYCWCGRENFAIRWTKSLVNFNFSDKACGQDQLNYVGCLQIFMLLMIDRSHLVLEKHRIFLSQTVIRGLPIRWLSSTLFDHFFQTRYQFIDCLLSMTYHIADAYFLFLASVFVHATSCRL